MKDWLLTRRDFLKGSGVMLLFPWTKPPSPHRPKPVRARGRLIMFLILPLMLAAGPQPQGTLTLTDTTPVTFTATTSHVGRRDHVWVSTRCWDAAGNPTYYGEEIERNGVYIMDDTVWVLWFGTVAEGTCRAFLIFRDESTPGEIVLDDTGFFQAP